MINQTRRESDKGALLRRSKMRPTGSKVRANPGPMMKSILGRAPWALVCYSRLELRPAVLGEECSIKVTPQENQVCRTKNRQGSVEFWQVHIFKSIKSGSMSQLPSKDMNLCKLEAGIEIIPCNGHKTECTKSILNQPLTSNFAAKPTETRQKKGSGSVGWQPSPLPRARAYPT